MPNLNQSQQRSLLIGGYMLGLSVNTVKGQQATTDSSSLDDQTNHTPNLFADWNEGEIDASIIMGGMVVVFVLVISLVAVITNCRQHAGVKQLTYYNANGEETSLACAARCYLWWSKMFKAKEAYAQPVMTAVVVDNGLSNNLLPQAISATAPQV